MNITEAKLTTEHRNELEDKDFGLPSERKFPLIDKQRVLSAIQYFRYCKKSQRFELAKNINKRLKELNLIVNVDPLNPFYKYIDRNYLEETTITPNKKLGCSLINGEVLTPIYNFIDSIYPLSESFEDIINKEKQFLSFYNKNKHIFDNTSLKYLLDEINTIIDKDYEKYFKYCRYDNIDCDNIQLSYIIIKDIRRLLMWGNADITYFGNYLISLSLFFEVNSMIKRCLIYITLHKGTNCIIDEIDDKINISKLKNIDDITEIFYNFINTCKYPLYHISNYLEDRCNKNKNELYIINKDINNYKPEFILPYSQISNTTIRKKVILLEDNNIDDKIFSNILKDYSSDLTELDILEISKNTNIKNICIGHLKHIICWYGIDGDRLFYIFKSIKGNNILLISIGDDATIYSLVNSDSKFNIDTNNDNVDIISINNEHNKMVNESFQINKDGDIKLTINSKKSYMDKYMEIHRVLVENSKTKNYENMKVNIGFMFVLINKIERDKGYKKKDTEVMKARAFAINDFKTYLKRIHEVEPDFDFLKYYRDNDYDKIIINISANTIAGITKLFKSII